MLDGLIFMLFIGGIYGICYLIALPIAKRRILWAKNMNIGEDSEEIKEELRNIARDIILEKKIPDEMEDAEATIVKEEGKITSVKMKTEKTLLTLKTGGETSIINIAYSEKTAAAKIAFEIMTIVIFVLLIFAAIIVGV